MRNSAFRRTANIGSNRNTANSAASRYLKPMLMLIITSNVQLSGFQTFLHYPTLISATLQSSDRRTFAVRQHLGPELSSFEPVTIEEVRKQLSTMPSKSSPLDMLPCERLKSYAHVFVPAIARLANLSLQTGKFPARYKTAQVLPLLKKVGLDSSLPAESVREDGSASVIHHRSRRRSPARVCAWPSVVRGLLQPSGRRHRSARRTVSPIRRRHAAPFSHARRQHNRRAVSSRRVYH